MSALSSSESVASTEVIHTPVSEESLRAMSPASSKLDVTSPNVPEGTPMSAATPTSLTTHVSSSGTSPAASSKDTPLNKETSSVFQTMKSALQALLGERDILKSKLAYANSTILELQRQNKALVGQNAELCAAHKTASSDWKGGNWIGGTWLIIPANQAVLGPAETSWQQGKPQVALNLLTDVLNRPTLTFPERVDAGLLFAAILRSAGRLDKSLEHVEMALDIALNAELFDHVGKARFHQGLCYFYMDRYADASWCFTLATHTVGHRDLVEVNRLMAERKRVEKGEVGISGCN